MVAATATYENKHRYRGAAAFALSSASWALRRSSPFGGEAVELGCFDERIGLSAMMQAIYSRLQMERN
jgi:hypothetical protein